MSGTGTASGGLVGVSGANSSSGLVAVSGDGTAAGTYSANSWGQVSAEGNSVDGQTANGTVNGSTLMDEAGVAFYPVDDQVANANFEPPADVLQAKATELANTTPLIAHEIAACAAGCSAFAATCNGCPPNVAVGVPHQGLRRGPPVGWRERR